MTKTEPSETEAAHEDPMIAIEDKLSDLVSTFEHVDWENLETVHDAADKALLQLSSTDAVDALMCRLVERPELVSMCEHFLSFTKLVLLDHPSGLRLRLHVFGDSMVEEAHNHRNSFTTRILRGQYRHYLYGNVSQDGVMEAPVPRMIHDQVESHVYTIHHEFVHSTYALPGTVSMVIQGPRVRSDFKIRELKTGVNRARVGDDDAQGMTQEDGERRVTVDDVREVHRSLRQWGLAQGPSTP